MSVYKDSNTGKWFCKFYYKDWKGERHQTNRRLYEYPTGARLFNVVPKAVENKFKRDVEKANVKPIRIHDLRHSHVSYLIEQGVDATVIKDRLGHKDIKITLNTYGHLYPDKQKEVADMLNKMK